MATRKSPPRKNTDVIRCENCGEEYSTTYKRCPFCDQRPGGQSHPSGGGGRRISRSRDKQSGGPVNPLHIVGFAFTLVLVAAAVIIVITTLSPMLFQPEQPGSQSSGGSSQTQNITLDTLSLSRTEVSLQAGETFQLMASFTPADAQAAVTWSSSNDDIATVDEYGNVTNVYRGSDEVSATVIASAGGLTIACTVRCTGDGTGENIDTTGAATGGQTAAGALAPNTEAVITGATGGLNIRSGPGTEYETKASTQDGATVTVLEDAGNGWYRIEYATGGGNLEEGSVMGDYLAPSES